MPAVTHQHTVALHVQATDQRVPVPLAEAATLHRAGVVDGLQPVVVAVVFYQYAVRSLSPTVFAGLSSIQPECCSVRSNPISKCFIFQYKLIFTHKTYNLKTLHPLHVPGKSLDGAPIQFHATSPPDNEGRKIKICPPAPRTKIFPPTISEKSIGS
ncbi:hypothetical protein ACQUJS_15335 [Ralstonia pseudosolanacearum]